MSRQRSTFSRQGRLSGRQMLICVNRQRKYGRIHQRARKRQEKAKDNIELAIHETDEKVCEYLKQCVELVDRRNIVKITADNGRGVKITISKTNKDTIKVTKKVSKDVVYDE